MTIQIKKQLGVGLIEVLIAAVVFAVGIGAVVKLQGTFFQSGSNAHARTTAISMAQAKLDELHAANFADIDGGNDDPTPASGTPFTYARSWTSTSYYYDAGVLTECPGPPDPCIVDQKMINVAVTWNDLDTNNDTVSLSSVINKNPSDASSTLIGYTTGGSGEKPVRIHNPGLLPDVVPVSISQGDDIVKETSKPTPDVTNNLDFTETYFEVTTYLGGSNELVKSEEFLTINCACQQAGTADTGRAPSRQTLVTENNEAFVKYLTGEVVPGKRIGERISTGQKGQQSVLCTECCRDHHDTSESTVKYDPFREVADYTDGDHNHYELDNNDQLVLANDDNDTYLEACRLKRIDGNWRVMQDWRVANVKTIPESTLTNPTTLAGYQDYVKQYVKDYVDTIPTDGNNSGAIIPSTIWADEPNSLTLALNGQIQLGNRALYIDFMDSSWVNYIKSTKTNSGYSDDVLQLIPFYEVNITKLSNWSSQNPNLAGADNDPDFNEPLEDNNQHGRGLVTAHAAGDTGIKSTIEMSNTGLTDTGPVDPQDANIVASTDFSASDTNGRSDSLTVSISGTPPPSPTKTISGSITLSNNTDITLSDVIVAASDTAQGSCSKVSWPAPATIGYNCILADGVDAITIVFSNYNKSVILPNGNPATTDNFVCPSGGIVTNDGTLTETTALQYTNVIDSLTVNVTIKHSGSCNN